MNRKKLFEMHILERGYDYYCKNAVENLDVSDDIMQNYAHPVSLLRKMQQMKGGSKLVEQIAAEWKMYLSKNTMYYAIL